MKFKDVAEYRGQIMGQAWVQSLLHSDFVSPKALQQKVLCLHTRLVKLQKNPALAGKVEELLQEPFLLQSAAERQTKPAQKKREKIIREAPTVQEALVTVNKQLASDLAITQSKCQEQESV